MRHKLLKRILVVLLSVGLVLSQAVPSFADTSGRMEPDDYLFLAIFRACGVSPGVRVGCWTSLYKGYLRSTGDYAMLSRVEGYGSLDWGDTAEGVDEVFTSVKNWLALSGSYGTDNTEYSLPSSPFPEEYPLFSFSSRISTEPFSECLIDESDQEGYHYLFSESYLRSDGTILKRNYYIPEGEKVVGVFFFSSYYSYCDRFDVKFYKADSSDPLGYSFCFLRTETCIVDSDGSVSKRYPSATTFSLGSDMCSVMNFPFYVFNNAADMENYLKTGEVNNVFTSNSGFLTSLGEEAGLDPGLQGEGIALTNSAVVLPADLSEAAARVEAFQKPLSRDELMAMLAADGFSAVKGASYKVGHYRESMAAGADGEPVWENYLEETFYGAPGAVANFIPLDLEGYTYAPELTEPENKEILEDGSLVVRLHYTIDRVPYTVEHYKQVLLPGQKGKSWTLTDTETLQGIPGMEAECPPKDYSGYALDDSLTEPSDRLVLPDGSLVIRLYYIQAPFSMLVEPIKNTLSSTLPLAVVIGSIISGGFFTVKLYKRISDKV